MGVDHLFRDELADFSDLSTTNCAFDFICHTAKIKIDEQGTTAAAATFSGYLCETTGDRIFHCTRPFIFIIHEQTRNQILFSGIYRGPESLD